MSTFIKYEKNKVFVTLTIILIIFTLILIRECDYPLKVNNSIMYFLFVHHYSEKLLYNISISYIAAYIFYIIQVYIPLTLKNRNAINLLRASIIKEINYLKYALCILNASIDKKDNSIVIKQDFQLPLYIDIEKDSIHYLRRFSYGKTLSKLKDSTVGTQKLINNSNCLHELDSYIERLLTNLPIEELFTMLEYIEQNIGLPNVCRFKTVDIVTNIEKQIQKLECIPQLHSVCVCTINYDSNLHSKYNSELSLLKAWDEDQYTINLDEIS